MTDDWVAQCVDKALEASPVPTGVASKIISELCGGMSERALPAAELNKLAKALLEIGPSPAEPSS